MPSVAIIGTMSGGVIPPTTIDTWLGKNHWAQKHYSILFVFILKGLLWSNCTSFLR